MCTTRNSIDTLIVGQGLAGSILAYKLIEAGQKVTIIDHGSGLSASRVAAGLINPVTGQRFVLQEHADRLLHIAKQFYQQLERRYHQKLYHELTMLRLLKSEKEQQAVNKRMADRHYQPYLQPFAPTTELLDSKKIPSSLHAPHGIIEQKQTGYLDTNRLLDQLQQAFIQQHSYISACFNYNDLKIATDHISWRHINTKRVIFCEGYRVRENPWFHNLPLQATKGEIITFDSSTPLTDKIINRGHWLLPLDHHRYRAGASYSHQLYPLCPDAQIRQSLLDTTNAMFTDPIDSLALVNHQVGIRPNTRDKKPWIGFHPKQPQLGLFNGFGSKGSMMIPHYADCFTAKIQSGKRIPDDVDLKRVYP